MAVPILSRSTSNLLPHWISKTQIGEYLDNDYLINVLTSGNLGIHKDDLGNILIYPSNSKFETFNEAAIFCHYLAKIGKHSLASQLFVDLKYNTDWQKASDYDEKNQSGEGIRGRSVAARGQNSSSRRKLAAASAAFAVTAPITRR